MALLEPNNLVFQESQNQLGAHDLIVVHHALVIVTPYRWFHDNLLSLLVKDDCYKSRNVLFVNNQEKLMEFNIFELLHFFRWLT